MSSTMTAPVAKSNRGTEESFGMSRRELRTTHLVMRKARAVFHVKTAIHLHELTGYSVRSCEAWLAGQSKIPSDALAALIHSEHGFDFLSALMAGRRPSWWSWLNKLRLVSKVRRLQQSSDEILREALDADADIAATLVKAETALGLQDPDFHRPHFDAVRAIAGDQDRPLAAKRGR